MNIPNTAYRSKKAEIMDDFDLQGEELRKTLKDLDTINKWLGGNSITINGVKKLLMHWPKQEISIADMGCGSGTVLRKLALWGRKNGFKLKLTGIDANPHAIKIARELAFEYPEIEFVEHNIFDEDFKKLKFHIILCTLTLHHFKKPEIISILNNFYRQTEIGIIINDLHRSRTAYFLFQAFCRVFINNEIARKDGLISILRGFKREDLQILASKIPAVRQEISWQWAFRFRWIIKK